MKFVPNAVSQKVARQMLKGRKASPTLLLGAGVLGMVGATVLACRATLKLEGVVEQTQMDLQAARAKTDVQSARAEAEDRTPDAQRLVTRAYITGAFNTAKLYAPSVLLGAASIGCLTKSHNIMARRNAALTAAYVAVDQAFQEYRERVVAKYGEDEDRELRFAYEDVDVYDAEGKLSVERRVAPEAHSMYARFFDEYSKSWSPEPEYNFVFLKCQQNYLNDMLKSRGHVFLNEVYDCLGLERTTAGSVVGWVISDGGDNYIDFGIFGSNSEQVRNFVNGREGSILLDFNVDGVIYDKIDAHKRGAIAWQS